MLQKDYFEVAHHHDTEDNYKKDIVWDKKEKNTKYKDFA